MPTFVAMVTMVIQAESSENVDTTSLIGDKWTGWTSEHF